MGFKVDDLVHPDSVAIARQYECAVCLCYLYEPVQTSCNHLFCAGCVDKSERCPTCRTPLGPEDCKPLATCSIPLLRFINGVQVRCPYRHASSASSSKDENNNTQGADELAAKRARVQDDEVQCDWTGSYDDLLAKHLSECPHHVIACPHGCGESLARGALTTHATTCIKNFIVCSICGDLVRPDAMEKHDEEKAQSHVRVLQAKLQNQKQEVAQMIALMMRGKVFKWDISNVTELLRDVPKGQMRRSSEFWVGADGPCHLEYYPNGDTAALAGNSSIFWFGPKYLLVKLKITIAGEVKEFTELSEGGFGWRDSFSVPTTPRVAITVEVKDSCQKLTMIGR